MVIHPDFINHWKTRLLIARIGREAALVALLALWAYCERKRAWELRLSPLELAGMCDYQGEPVEFFNWLIEFRFLDRTIDPSWFRVHDWENVNSGLVSKWKASKAKTHVWHPRGYLTPYTDSSIASSIDESQVPSIDPSIEPTIGLDRIGLDLNTPIVPQGGRAIAAAEAPNLDAGKVDSIHSETEISDGKKKKRPGPGPVVLAEIYAAYPRKVGRDKAFKAIDKALHRSALSAVEMLARVQAFATAAETWADSDREFIPHPATWFNQGRYDDDPREWQRASALPPGAAFSGQKNRGGRPVPTISEADLLMDDVPPNAAPDGWEIVWRQLTVAPCPPEWNDVPPKFQERIRERLDGEKEGGVIV